MAPQPHRVELDLDRKEELLIQKQLRACRVNIMPRNVDHCYKVNSLSPSPSPRTPQSPNPQAQQKVDSSPIAMRYWNQCQSVRAPDNPGENQFTEQDVVDELAMKMQKLSQKNVKKQSASKVEALPAVPDIRNKMKESNVPSSPKIMITDTDNRRSVMKNDAEPSRVLSTAGNVVNRENEKSEALSNINRFITVDQFSVPEQSKQGESSQKTKLPPKLPFLGDIQLLKRSEPKTPKNPIDQSQAVPQLPVKQKINAHIGHIENRPKMGDLPFLNDIKSIGEVTGVKPNYNENADNVSNTQNNTVSNSRTLPEVQTSPCVTEKIENENFRNIMQRKLKSPSPKIVRFSEKEASQNPSKRNSYVAPNTAEKEEVINTMDDPKPMKPPKVKKAAKFNIKIDEKTNMSKLSDQIIPQLNTMQKNYLGLLFFNELSQSIVEDMVAQQLSMMPGTKLASVLNSLEQQVCDTAVPLMLNCVSEDLRTALVCESFGELSTQDKAGVLFTTGDDVMEVCSTITDFGGRAFKKALIKNMINNEDKDFMDEIVQEHIKDQRRNNTRTVENNGARLSVMRDEQKHFSSADEENYNSAEESLADVVDDEVYQYEYYEFENK